MSFSAVLLPPVQRIPPDVLIRYLAGVPVTGPNQGNQSRAGKGLAVEDMNLDVRAVVLDDDFVVYRQAAGQEDAFGLLPGAIKGARFVAVNAVFARGRPGGGFLKALTT